jgi:hypothetical protein
LLEIPASTSLSRFLSFVCLFVSCVWFSLFIVSPPFCGACSSMVIYILGMWLVAVWLVVSIYGYIVCMLVLVALLMLSFSITYGYKVCL